MIYLLDLLGVFAFSFYGAYVALKKDLDIFGVVVCATLTAIGGGTIRELILNHTPFYFHDYNYLYIIFLGTIFSILTYKNFHIIDKYMLIVDAVGLVTFAFIGSKVAVDANLGLVGAIFFAVITAVGGGMLRDVVIREVPSILYQDLYATFCIILATLYYFFRDYMSNLLIVYGLLLFIFLLRVFVIYHKLNVWVPSRKFEQFTHLTWIRDSNRNPLPILMLLVSLLIALVLNNILPIANILYWPVKFIGLIFIVVGLNLVVFSLYYLKTYQVIIHEGDIPSKLIKTGPFKFSRNPVYLGFFAVTLGVAFLLGSLSSFFVPILFLLVINSTVIPLEETILKKTFKQEYLHYQKSVRKWI